MKSKYKILIQISLFLSMIAVSISMVNYYITIKQSKEQLKTISLPLSLDNIYTEIQKNIIQPYLVSSMMANDTFVQNWLKEDKQDKKKIVEYLSTIKNKYNMFNAFLVSDISKKYYTQKDFIETLHLNDKKDQWYLNFINSKKTHEINIDKNKNLSNSLVIFINNRIVDNNNKLLGVTGVALKTQYIDDMLKKFREKYGFHVTFFNQTGDVVLSEKNYSNYNNINNSFLKDFKNNIISKNSNVFEIQKNNQDIIVHTKYIEELDLYLIIEVDINDYTNSSLEVLYFNLLASLSIVLFVVFILYKIIHKHSQKLESMAFIDPLTKLHNRRFILSKISESIIYAKRNKQSFSVAFFDIDNFKKINDTKGHSVGDKVLKKFSYYLKNSIRESDAIARWGGEEIVVLFQDTNVDNAKIISEKLRLLIEEKLISYNLTVSIGITEFIESDDVNSIIKRSDKAMYISKDNGKNQISVL